MILLQLQFSRGTSGEHWVNVRSHNTNFLDYYFGPGHDKTMTALTPDLLNAIVSFLSSPSRLNISQPSVNGIVLTLSATQLNSLVAHCCHTAAHGTGIICKVTQSFTRLSLTFYDADGEDVSVPAALTLSNVYTATSLFATLIQLSAFEQNPFDVHQDMGINKSVKTTEATKSRITCRQCGNAVGAKEIALSTGETIVFCPNCLSTTDCAICSYKEPSMYIKYSVTIDDETGKDKRSSICRKCANKLTTCRNCNFCFDKKQDEACPCRYRTDFKGYIKAHNDDVLKYYKMDMFSNELFGIEMELGTLNKNRRRFPEIAELTNELVQDNAILKYDSSIDWLNKQEQVDNAYKGFEVVTRPMIYKNALRFLKDFCKNVHPSLRSWEVGTCGLHIHVSKACLRPIEIGKILKFINNKNNRKFIRMIAKREDKKYAKFLTKKITDYQNSTPGPNGSPQEHYEAINTSKEYTIEFRIFRGTLNIRTVMSYLQFVKSTIEFVRVTRCDDDSLTYQNYLDFLFSTEKSQFRELKERIRKENLKDIAEEGEI